MANPLVQQDRKIPPASDSSRDPLSIPSEIKASIRVLVVDDERTLRESCASVLQMDGYNVTLIGRGEEALETVRRRKFDVILVDLYMSQVSGLEILQSTLEAYKDTSPAASRRCEPAPGTTCPSLFQRPTCKY
jgi:PleD family two-component response regulator